MRPRCEPPLPSNELLEHPTLSHIIFQLATALDVRGHFSDGPECDWWSTEYFLNLSLVITLSISLQQFINYNNNNNSNTLKTTTSKNQNNNIDNNNQNSNNCNNNNNINYNNKYKYTNNNKNDPSPLCVTIQLHLWTKFYVHFSLNDTFSSRQTKTSETQNITKRYT